MRSKGDGKIKISDKAELFSLKDNLQKASQSHTVNSIERERARLLGKIIEIFIKER